MVNKNFKIVYYTPGKESRSFRPAMFSAKNFWYENGPLGPGFLRSQSLLNPK